MEQLLGDSWGPEIHLMWNGCRNQACEGPQGGGWVGFYLTLLGRGAQNSDQLRMRVLVSK